MDCSLDENAQDVFCIKEKRKQFCASANKNPNYVFKKEDGCCEHIFKECEVIHTENIINGCC